MQADPTDDILGPKKLNYDFLLLVRDKKYAEALTLGRKILQNNPDNPSVQKFCSFIQKNHSEILKMVERQKEEEEYESVDSDQQGEQEEEQEEGEGQEKQEGDQKSSQSEKSDEEEDEPQQENQVPKEKKDKIELTTCTLNQIPHICPRHHREKKQETETTASTEVSSVKKEE